MLSVIMPVYGVEEYLEQSVACLLNQKDCGGIEIILVDDGSKDRSGEICDSLAKKHGCVKVIHQKNLGVSSARNNGIDAAGGEYIAFMDPDDYADPDYCAEMLIEMAKYGCDIVFSRYKRVFESGETQRVFEPDLEKLAAQCREVTPFFKNLDGNEAEPLMGYVWRSVFKKSIIDGAGLRFNEKIAFSEDLIFLLQYLSHCKSCRVLDKYDYNYRVRGTSATAVSYKKDLFENRVQCLNEYERLINENSVLTDTEKRLLIGKIKYTSAKEIIYNEMRFNKNAVKTLKEYYKSGFAEIFLDSTAAQSIEHCRPDKATALVLSLAQKKLLTPLKLMYKLKYAKER